MTQTQTIAAKAAEAAQKAEAARDRARALQAEAELAEAREQDRREAKRAEFYQKREAGFVENFIKPLQARRAEFEEAVLAGTGFVQAWINYMTAVRAADAEERGRNTRRHNTAMAMHEAIAHQLMKWQEELQAIRAKEAPLRRAFIADQEPTGSWSEGIEALIGEDEPREGENRVEQINRRINELAKALDVDRTREPDSLDWIHVSYFTNRPYQPLSETSPSGRENRSMHQAIEDVIAKRLEETVAAASKQRADEIEDYINS